MLSRINCCAYQPEEGRYHWTKHCGKYSENEHYSSTGADEGADFRRIFLNEEFFNNKTNLAIL